MVENDNPIYYIVYALILIAFYFILKAPKIDDKQDDQK